MSTLKLSTNPIGLSDHLVRPNQPSNEPLDLDAEITTQIEALAGVLDVFERTNGQPNAELISATTAVNDLQVKLNEATHKLEQIKASGTPLDRLKRATVLAETALTKLIERYTKVVTAELLKERFGLEVNIMKLPSVTRQEIRLHRRIEALRQFEPLRTSSEFHSDTEERIQQRLNATGERLDALREHIRLDQSVEK